MLKIVEVAKAWISAANPTTTQKIIAEHRASVCDTCPSKAHNATIDLYYCSECGCPLSKKIFSPVEGPKACPLAKWEK
jgi:ribosomal protein L37E